MFLSDEQVAAWLQALTDKQFIAFFYEHLAARRIKGDGIADIDTHLALVEVRRLRDERGERRPPMVELLCPSARESKDDAPIMWSGRCCGFRTGSWRRFATCPVCGGVVADEG